ncbi:MAG: type II toxin-antitoxin system RelB/DinJ family antitoxin [Methylovulum sp.]|jgi:DNA-damage-inducible protein J
MKTDIITIRLEHDLKVEFTHICAEIGLNPSQAIKLFAKAVINHGGIPFELKAKQPNSETIAAMQELAQGQGHKVANTHALFAELDIDLPHA